MTSITSVYLSTNYQFIKYTVFITIPGVISVSQILHQIQRAVPVNSHAQQSAVYHSQHFD